MSFRLSQRLWVGMVVVMVVELPGALQKCVFDEVQAQVRVVRAAPVSHPDSPPSEAGVTAPLTSEQQASHPGWRARPSPALPQPIRIQTWIPRESDNLSDAEKARVEAAVEEAVRTVSSILSVKREPGPLLLSRDVVKYCKFLWRDTSTVNYDRCVYLQSFKPQLWWEHNYRFHFPSFRCGRANQNYRTETCLDVTVPDDHLAGCDIYPEADSPRRIALRPDGAGLANTDFLLYPHVKSTDKCRAEPRVVAYAAHCRTDAHGRPLAGVVVICRDRLSERKYHHKTTVQMLIHELVHALGFSKHLFRTWRDCSSSSRAGTACSPRSKVTHSDGSGQVRIYSQSVTSAMQKHLASADPELGGPLENLDVPPGGVSSHWESRVLQGSIMAAALEDWTTVRIDPVTLAALQDTGWYRVNLSQAQSLVWGDGEGAMFGSLSTCKDNSSSFFCTGSGHGCHFLHLHKGKCQTDLYLDGCRVYKLLQNASECWKKENSLQSAEQLRSGEIFGFDSRCFFSNLTGRWSENEAGSLVSGGPVEGRCYRHRCTGLNQYQIQVSNSEWLSCPAGGTIRVKGYWGVVFCPNRRLCLFPDTTPPSDDISTLPASTSGDPYWTFTAAQDGSFRSPAEVTAAAALCFTAAVSLPAAALMCYRKCRTRRLRIHPAAADITDRV